jgi:hypothetical protein
LNDEILSLSDEVLSLKFRPQSLNDRAQSLSFGAFFSVVGAQSTKVGAFFSNDGVLSFKFRAFFSDDGARSLAVGAFSSTVAARSLSLAVPGLNDGAQSVGNVCVGRFCQYRRRKPAACLPARREPRLFAGRPSFFVLQITEQTRKRLLESVLVFPVGEIGDEILVHFPWGVSMAMIEGTRCITIKGWL